VLTPPNTPPPDPRHPSPLANGPWRTWAEIDLDAVRHNAGAVRAQVGPDVKIIAVVKANAYGHGVGPVAQALSDRVQMLAVANVTEAIELRGAVTSLPILILGPALAEERPLVVQGGFIPTISSFEEAAAYNELASGKRLPIHLAFDTGMGRIGIWGEEAKEALAAIRDLSGLEIAALASHLPVADEDEAFTREQLGHFSQLTGTVAPFAPAALTHVHNSAGIIGFPEQSGGMVRAGLMLYGSAPIPEFQPRLRAVMTWKTRITLIREVGVGRGISYGRTFIVKQPMRVATLAVGYADGYQRHLSNHGAEVLIRGRRCAVLGRVTMDQIMVDVTDLPEVQPGEEVVLLGRQGDEEILALELAEKAGTIAWEIFTSVGRRVHRIYLNS
jgi:alanine racemase